MAKSKEVAEVIRAAKMIASMKYPSVEKLLRQNRYGYEADRVADLVAAVEKLPNETLTQDTHQG